MIRITAGLWKLFVQNSRSSISNSPCLQQLLGQKLRLQLNFEISWSIFFLPKMWMWSLSLWLQISLETKNLHLRPESSGTEVNTRRVDLVVQYVHYPGREERWPPNDDHGGDMVSGHLVGIPMDIYQCHLFSCTYKGGHCQSESNDRHEKRYLHFESDKKTTYFEDFQQHY